ncbi:unnamed protein product [Phytophthora fragariaefolia]|uniref:Unnamed protein product n=1 Tax=Phytophthora fragariaefolia TaxID=1490495 RepID=A0A9W6YCF6_9STRA|nr:unnamed protein product [Phytophthora fragariaefolia]
MCDEVRSQDSDTASGMRDTDNRIVFERILLSVCVLSPGPLPQRNLTEVFAAAADGRSSDEGPDPASDEEEASNGSTPLVRSQTLDEEMRDGEVVSTPRVIGMCVSCTYTLRIRVINLNMYSHAVLDTFANDPNICRPDDTGDYAALNSDGEFEGNSATMT